MPACKRITQASWGKIVCSHKQQGLVYSFPFIFLKDLTYLMESESTECDPFVETLTKRLVRVNFG